jgi:exodeoxyribonuclease V
MTRRELDSLSEGQEAALAAIVKWHDDGGYPPLTLGGLAGTGKTTLTGLLPEVLPRAEIAFCAYTGKAASVLRAKLPEDIPGDRVSTIHRLLYTPAVTVLCAASDQVMAAKAARCPAHRQAPEPCTTRQQVSFSAKPDPLAGLDLVVADEASMIPGRLWEDLTRHGVPVLAVGDHGQLPPVQSSFSLMAHPDITLEEIHRQAAGSPILAVARWAREQGRIPAGWYGENVVKIAPHEIGYAGLHPGDADMIICATNKTRQYHNAALRAWHGRSGPPQPGDVVICLRNNYEEGLFNGLRGTILEASGHWEHPDELELTVELDGEDVPWTGKAAAGQFGAASTLSSAPRDLALFDWGYAGTCHKFQGSQAEKVLVIEEGWPAEPDMRKRWLYTAVTRAERELTVAGW